MATTTKQKVAVAAIVIAGALAGAGVLHTGAPDRSEDTHEHVDAAAAHAHEAGDGHSQESDHEHAKPASLGGAVTVQGDVTVEVALSEEGGEPRIRIWTARANVPLSPSKLDAMAHLRRPGGEAQVLKFEPSDGFLQSTSSVEEPHVFEAEISVQVPGVETPVVAKFSSDEGKVSLSPAQLAAASIVVEAAGPAELNESHRFPGEIRFNEDRTAHIVPRLAGVVESVSANLGQEVRKGDVLAAIASTSASEQRSELLTAEKRLQFARTAVERERTLWEEKISAEQDYLQARRDFQEAQIAVQNARQKLSALGAGGSLTGNRLELRAPFDGTIVEKHLTLGEAVKEDANVFTLSDLRSVWAQFLVAPKDLANVRVGHKVRVTSTAFDSTAEGTVSYVGSLVGEQTRTAIARATLSNPELAWRPGLFVTVEVEVGGDKSAPVTVRADAVQSLDDETVVFLAVPGGFVAQPVKLGRSDGTVVEVTEGLTAGARYAATNTFVLKSELGKSSATHVH